MSTTEWQLTVVVIAVIMDGLFILGWRDLNQRRRRSALQTRPAEPRIHIGLTKIAALPAGVITPILLVIGFAAQASFDTGPSGRALGIFLLLALIPAMGLFVYLENRSVATQANRASTELASSISGFTLSSIADYPRRTFLGTLALVISILCASQAKNIENNLMVAFLWLSSVALFIAAVVPEDWNLDVSAFWPTIRQNRIEVMVVIAILAVGAFARLNHLEKYPFGTDQDEGLFASEALRVISGERLHLFGVSWYFDHTAVYTYLQAGSMSIFGQNVSGMRALSGTMGVVSLVFTFLLARRMFGKGAAVLTLSLTSFAPFHLMFSRMGIHDMIVMLTFIPAVVYFLYSAVASRKAIHFSMAGLLLGIGLWFDYNNKIMILIPLAAGILGYVTLISRGFWKAEYPKIALTAAGAALTLLPLWSTLISLDRIWQDPARGKGLFNNPENLRLALERFQTDSVAVVLAHQIELNVLALNHIGDQSFLGAMGQRPLLDGLTGVFCFIGVAYCLWNWKKPAFGILLFLWVAGFQMGIWSDGAPQFHRLTPVIIPSYMMAALSIVILLSQWGKMLNWPKTYATAITTLIAGSITVRALQTFLAPQNYSAAWFELCETGKAIKAWSADHNVIYLGRPWQDTQHGTILFCSNLASMDADNAADAAEVAPLPEPTRRDLAIIFSRGNLDDFEAARKFYPQATPKVGRDLQVEVMMRALLVSQAEANRMAINDKGTR